MKTRLFVILAILLIILTGCSKLYTSESPTFEEVLDSSNPEKINIEYFVITKKGVILFYNKFSEDELSVCFVKKVMGGWKYIYGGTQMEVSVVANEVGDGLYANYFPSIKNTPFPMFYGIITNPEITKVEIIQKEDQKRIETDMITSESMTIWLNYSNSFDGNEFYVVGLNEKGTEVTRIEIDTSNY